jgi:hypothetical protein
MTILDMMTHLEDLHARRQLAVTEHVEAVKEIIPADIRANIEALNADYDSTMEEINDAIRAAEDRVKQAVLKAGETVKGTRYHAIWSKPRVSWDDKRLEEYFRANDPNALDRMRKVGKPSVSIRQVKA